MNLTKNLKDLGFRQKTSKMLEKIPRVRGPIGTNGFPTNADKRKARTLVCLTVGPGDYLI